jgi:hypothetical protein
VGDPPARGLGVGLIGWGGTDWINLDQDKDQWRAPLDMLMNHWVLLNAGKFLSS